MQFWMMPLFLAISLAYFLSEIYIEGFFVGRLLHVEAMYL